MTRQEMENLYKEAINIVSNKLMEKAETPDEQKNAYELQNHYSNFVRYENDIRLHKAMNEIVYEDRFEER